MTRRLILGTAAALLPGLALAATMAHELRLTHRDGRTTDYRVLTPRRAKSLGVVLFSHGAASGNGLYDRILEPWAAAGFMVIAPNHLDAGGSPDPKVVSGVRLWSTRVQDTTAPLDQHAAFDAIAAGLGARLDWARACVAGHSFGGAVAQAIAGAPMEGIAKDSIRHPGVASVLCLSPPGPRHNFVPQDAWAPVTLPALLQTGTADILPGFIDDWQSHKQGFDNQAGRNRWLIVGDGVDHYFGGLICRLADGPKAVAQAPALAATTRITTDFLLAYARGDTAALSRLSRAARDKADAPTVSLTKV